MRSAKLEMSRVRKLWFTETLGSAASSDARPHHRFWQPCARGAALGRAAPFDSLIKRPFPRHEIHFLSALSAPRPNARDTPRPRSRPRCRPRRNGGKRRRPSRTNCLNDGPARAGSRRIACSGPVRESQAYRRHKPGWLCLGYSARPTLRETATPSRRHPY
jgi:hypothetical protein